MVETVRQRAMVREATAEAVRHGVRAGISLAEARALCPGITAIDHEPVEDSRALRGLAEWMTRFTPAVSIGWPEEEEVVSPPPLLLLDLRGCQRLFGPTAGIVARIARVMERSGVPARVAWGETALLAWGRALAGQGAPAEAIPVEALRLPAETVESLRGLGITTAGEVMALPREALPSRFGKLLGVRMEQLMGERLDPLVAIEHEVLVRAEVRFESAVDAIEALWAVLQELVGDVVRQLERRGRGARRVEAEFWPERATGQPSVVREVKLGRAEREGRRLFELLRGATEKLECGEGFVRVELRVPLHERTSQTQVSLGEEGRDEEGELVRLVERLALRLGEKAVERAVAVESFLAERAWRGVGWGEEVATGAAAPKKPRKKQLEPMQSAAPRASRPAWLLRKPLEIRVVAEPSDDGHGLPAQFTWRGKSHVLRGVIGPERVGQEWWRGRGKSRNYYDVMDEGGARFWIFRVPKTTDASSGARWFLHGIFR